MARTILDYQDLLKSLKMEDVKKIAGSGRGFNKSQPQIPSIMAMDEIKRRAEMRKITEGEEAEQQVAGARPMVDEYMDVARSLSAPPQGMGAPARQQMPSPTDMPTAPQAGGPPMGGPPMGGPPQAASPPQIPGYADGGPIGMGDEIVGGRDWRDVPGMISREHLIAHQRGYSGEGDWRFKDILPKPDAKDPGPYDASRVKAILGGMGGAGKRMAPPGIMELLGKPPQGFNQGSVVQQSGGVPEERSLVSEYEKLLAERERIIRKSLQMGDVSPWAQPTIGVPPQLSQEDERSLDVINERISQYEKEDIPFLRSAPRSEYHASNLKKLEEIGRDYPEQYKEITGPEGRLPGFENVEGVIAAGEERYQTAGDRKRLETHGVKFPTEKEQAAKQAATQAAAARPTKDPTQTPNNREEWESLMREIRGDVPTKMGRLGTSLMTAGATMMGGESPHAGVNVGRGLAAGVQEYTGQREAGQRARLAEGELRGRMADAGSRRRRDIITFEKFLEMAVDPMTGIPRYDVTNPADILRARKAHAALTSGAGPTRVATSNIKAALGKS